MDIELERFCYHPEGVLGKFILGESVVYTIERPWLNNVPYLSCIPEGEYKALPYSSEKYPDTYEVKDVPGRSKILFCHIGNFPEDVQGCFALGRELWDDRIAVRDSGSAMRRFRELLEGVEQINLTIKSFKPTIP